MNDFFRNLRHLEEGIKISLPTDDNGLTGRECPNTDCLGFFQVKFGTGLKGDNLPCYCPYCGHKANHDNFWTQEQLKYVESIMMNELNQALQNDVGSIDRRLRNDSRNSIIKLSVEFKGQYHPIQYYRERQLETNIVCNNCTLEYAIYGIFAFCPDCGEHNSFQILQKNFELSEKEISLSNKTEDNALKQYLIEDALENVISAFDGFGRTTVTIFSNKATDIEGAKRISFQNLESASKKVNTLFGIDLQNGIYNEEWENINRCFQKRHLLAHTLGVIDENYIKNTNDVSAKVGRKIVINAEEIQQLILLLQTIGANLVNSIK